MKKNFFHQVMPLAKKALVVNFSISLSVYAVILLMFHDFGFSWYEWITLLLKTVSISWLIVYAAMVTGKLLVHFATRQLKQPSFMRSATGVATLFFVSILLYSCKGGIQPFGRKIDLATGMATSYTGMVPTATRMVMNNEELNHTDIPLGEKFTVVNSGVEGLTVKDNKVSVGCSLSISDKTGKQVLFEPDLFKTGGVFDKDSATSLQCKVNTGAPMEWQKQYLVKIIYWDKYGTGKLENAVTISMEDEP